MAFPPSLTIPLRKIDTFLYCIKAIVTPVTHQILVGWTGIYAYLETITELPQENLRAALSIHDAIGTKPFGCLIQLEEFSNLVKLCADGDVLVLSPSAQDQLAIWILSEERYAHRFSLPIIGTSMSPPDFASCIPMFTVPSWHFFDAIEDLSYGNARIIVTRKQARVQVCDQLTGEKSENFFRLTPSKHGVMFRQPGFIQLPGGYNYHIELASYLCPDVTVGKNEDGFVRLDFEGTSRRIIYQIMPRRPAILLSYVPTTCSQEDYEDED